MTVLQLFKRNYPASSEVPQHHDTQNDNINLYILQWPEDTNTFESNDPSNGSWVILEPVKSNGIHNYYLDIKAKRTSCTVSRKTCSLQIYIASSLNSKDELDIPKTGKKTYLLNTFKKLYDVNFTKDDKLVIQSFNFTHTGRIAMLAMRARGIYGEMRNINLYYYHCQKTIVGSVNFVRTNAPLTGIKRVVANCTSNAISKFNGSSFEGWCWFNGTWSFPNDAKCFCKRGYETLVTGCIRK